MQIKKCISVLLASSFILPVLPAHAGEETVQLMSNGRYQTYSLSLIHISEPTRPY